MSDATIKLQIINAAILASGDGNPVASLATGRDGVQAAEASYENIVAAVLTSGPEWRFATKTEAPTLIGARSDGIFGYEWSLPADSLEIKAVLRQYTSIAIPTTDWEVEESKLLIDLNTGVLVRYIFRAGESVWHPNFKLGVQYMIEGVLQRAFWESESEASARESKAAVQFGIASRAAGHKRLKESRSIRRRRYGRPPETW